MQRLTATIRQVSRSWLFVGSYTARQYTKRKSPVAYCSRQGHSTHQPAGQHSVVLLQHPAIPEDQEQACVRAGQK